MELRAVFDRFWRDKRICLIRNPRRIGTKVVRKSKPYLLVRVLGYGYNAFLCSF